MRRPPDATLASLSVPFAHWQGTRGGVRRKNDDLLTDHADEGRFACFFGSQLPEQHRIESEFRTAKLAEDGFVENQRSGPRRIKNNRRTG